MMQPVVELDERNTNNVALPLLDASLPIQQLEAEVSSAQERLLAAIDSLHQREANVYTEKRSCLSVLHQVFTKEFGRAILYNTLVGFPIAAVAWFWFAISFEVSAELSLFIVGILLMALFALSWRAFAVLELKAIKLVGEQWLPVPSAAPIFPSSMRTYHPVRFVKAVLGDSYTWRVFGYFMMIKAPLSFAALAVTIGLPFQAVAMVVYAFMILTDSANNALASSSDNSNSTTSSLLVTPTTVWSAASTFDGSKPLGETMDWYHSHPVLVVMWFPLAVFILFAAYHLIIQIGRIQRTVAIHALAAPAPSQKPIVAFV